MRLSPLRSERQAENTCYNGVSEARACSSMDRASVFGTEGWGFESLQARQSQRILSAQSPENGYPDARWMGAGVCHAVAAMRWQDNMVACRQFKFFPAFAFQDGFPLY